HARAARGHAVAGPGLFSVQGGSQLTNDYQPPNHLIPCRRIRARVAKRRRTGHTTRPIYLPPRL
ncbi:MAG TPA: hypothetical protein VGQ96_05410, partial [Candidatus Eremiobacteraceae bacterium]|nr:hypothetical protein [Candidatus Eremiobacteraceae bacterium]